jgi:hypothetical protein
MNFDIAGGSGEMVDTSDALDRSRDNVLVVPRILTYVKGSKANNPDIVRSQSRLYLHILIVFD